MKKKREVNLLEMWMDSYSSSSAVVAVLFITIELRLQIIHKSHYLNWVLCLSLGVSFSLSFLSVAPNLAEHAKLSLDAIRQARQPTPDHVIHYEFGVNTVAGIQHHRG